MITQNLWVLLQTQVVYHFAIGDYLQGTNYIYWVREIILK